MARTAGLDPGKLRRAGLSPAGSGGYYRRVNRWLTALAGAMVSLSGCAGHTASLGEDAAHWPYSGYQTYRGPTLEVFRDRFFSGEGLAVAPDGRTLYAEAQRSGALTLVDIASASISSVFDFGEGARVEQSVVAPDGGALYLVASTIRAENIGYLPLARAILEVDLRLGMAQAPIEIPASGWSRGLALEAGRGWLFSLDTVGPDRSAGATLSRIDLYTHELSLRRAVGGLPSGMRRHGLTFDDRRDRLFAILGGEEPSDFDPPGTTPGETALVTLSLDSLTVMDRLPLRADVDYLGVFPAPRGVIVIGRDTRPGHLQTWLFQYDSRLMKETGWFDLPELATDADVQGGTAIVAVRRGLYVVDLGFLSIRAAVPLPVDRLADVALTPDERTAAVAMEDPDWPGRPVIGLIDLAGGRMTALLR